MKDHLGHIERGIVETVGFDQLKRRLQNGDRLVVKLGIDPTAERIHLGHAVQLLKLRDFQELGHQIVFIVGDFTAEIGDTSDKDSERPMLSTSAIKKNIRHYKNQAGQILDIWHAKVYYNSKWLKRLGFREIGEQANCFSVADFISRVNIKRRLDAGKRVSLRELLYPLMQGYDSVKIGADIEVGGTDQKFNLLAGRVLQEHYGQNPQGLLLIDLLPGTDGQKMSKSKGNVIWIDAAPAEMYGGIMSVPDEYLRQYFVHLTRVSLNEIDQLLDEGHPREVKMRLAREIVSILHSEKAAKEAEEAFVRVFQKKDLPTDITEIPVSSRELLSVLSETALVVSKSEGRRVLLQGGVRVNGEVVSDEQFMVPDGAIIQKGKRHFVRIK